MKSVTNISNDYHLLFDKNGKRCYFLPGMTLTMHNPPISAYPFKVSEIYIEQCEEQEENKTERRKKIK